ncbi:MAG: hypothetical protein H8E55_67070 [Pelagibacterales bacterium]|nr:hypothetical protein [Pelagibacterales bacterium]
MLSAEKIQANWNRYLKLIELSFSKERTDILLPFLEKYKDRIMMMPASSKNWHHSAFAGGYVDHVLRVFDCVNKLYDTWMEMGGDTSTYTKEEMQFAALFHDLGKMGQQEGEYYMPNDSKWHIDKLGMIYKFNTDIPAMKIPERSLFILQEIGCKVTQNEYITIKIHDGLYDESNKFYFMSGQKETRLRTHLPILMHQADHMAAQIEFEIWNKGGEIKQTSKKIKQSNNPKLASATLDVIDSFFKD